MYKRQLLHRDISPDNIYITSKGESRLLDFGAARFALGDGKSAVSYTHLDVYKRQVLQALRDVSVESESPIVSTDNRGLTFVTAQGLSLIHI